MVEWKTVHRTSRGQDFRADVRLQLAAVEPSIGGRNGYAWVFVAGNVVVFVCADSRKAEIAAIVQPDTLDFHGDPAGSSAWKKGRKTEKDADEIKLRVDAIHLNAEGKYLQACVWLAALFNVDVTKLAYEPALKDFSSRAKLMRECAAEAVAGAAVRGSE